MASKTFTIRVNPEDHDALIDLAQLLGKPASELAREFIANGLRQAMDPEAIGRIMDEEKAKMQRAAEELRAAHAKAAIKNSRAKSAARDGSHGP
ncbi:hypothetical protein G9444_6834 (plasmid) [Rhodococcus erythropolis]|uniref:Uncharacterized protein n=1 Tax=Rhodococcus erythropolis TaxID=1833 RepID=A0A6G9D4B6_RHOER|nr:hypothetical protein [Rhodococcus erythropolis]QIP44077.1 hypothetical protein G9444_6834 [Rhodococcus erythropolis]REK78062.1 hypothetical protein DVG80_32670 [Rhodococcus erythropolis]